MLEESVGDHRHERMAVTTLPEWSLEVIETALARTEQNPRRIPRSLHDISPRPTDPRERSVDSIHRLGSIFNPAADHLTICKPQAATPSSPSCVPRIRRQQKCVR